MSPKRTAIGIDLGGTNLRVALIDSEGRRLAEYFAATPSGVAAEALLGRIAGVVQRVQGDEQPIGVGIGVPGALDAEDRLIPGMSNISELAGVPISALLGAALGMPIRIENDARVAMLGEARFGAARGARNVLMLTLGTGIGGGLLLDGCVRAGPRRMAGEIGLSLVPTATGNGWQSLEDAASPGGLRRTEGLDLAAIAHVAASGAANPKARLAKVAELLGVSISNAHAILDLEMVLLSGGLTRAGAEFLAAVQDAVRRLCPPLLERQLTIAYAELGEWSGAVGAGALWLAPDHRRTELL